MTGTTGLRTTADMDQPISRRALGALPLGLALTAAAAGFDTAADAARPARRRMSAENRLDIIELFGLYAWNYDCGDAAGAAATFTSDGVIEAFGAEAARGRPAIADFITSLYTTERKDNYWQHYTDHHVFDGDGAACVVYSYWGILQGNAQNKDYGVKSFGYYRTQCLKEGGEWLMAKRGIHRWDRSKLPWA